MPLLNFYQRHREQNDKFSLGFLAGSYIYIYIYVISAFISQFPSFIRNGDKKVLIR